MPLLNLDQVSDAQKIYRAELFKSFTETPAFVEPVARVQVVNTGSVKVIGTLCNTQMREWLGERVIKDISHKAFEVTVKDYENTVGVPVNDFEDDNWNLYTPHFASMGQEAAHLRSRLVAGILEGTDAATGYDSKKLADDAHPSPDPESSSTFDNSVTTALSITAYEAARVYFASLVDDSGNPAGFVPTHIVVKEGGSADIAATELFESTHIYEDSIMKPNPYKGKVQVIRNPYLSSSTYWALLCLNRVEKPVLLYPRYPQPKFTAINTDNTEEVFLRNKFLFGTKYRIVAAVGLWMTAYISTGAGE